MAKSSKQPEPAAAPNEPTDYGLPPSKLYEALPLEHRTKPEAETGSSLTGYSAEFLLKHFPHLIVKYGRIRKITRKNSLDINTGRAQPKEEEDSAA